MKKYLLPISVVCVMIICSCGTKNADEIDTAVAKIKTLDNTTTPPAPLQDEVFADTTVKEA